MSCWETRLYFACVCVCLNPGQTKVINEAISVQSGGGEDLISHHSLQFGVIVQSGVFVCQQESLI